MTNRPIGNTIGLAFGGLWAVLGAQALPAAWQGPVLAGAAVITLALIIRLWRRRGSGGGAGGGLFRRPGYIVAVILELAAIIAASNLLPRWGLKAWFIQVLGVIVGLHFIGLWQATRARRFLAIAAGMCAVSLAAMLLPPGPRDLACGFGNALVLWAGAGLGRGAISGL